MTFEKITITHVSGDGKDYRIDCDPRDSGGAEGVRRTVRADEVRVNGQTTSTSTSVSFEGDEIDVSPTDLDEVPAAVVTL